MLRARPLFQAAKDNAVKHTGFAGLMPHPSPREALIEIYESTLQKLERLPAQYPFRHVTTGLTRTRLQYVQSEHDVHAIQSKFEEGPIEFVIHQAQAENTLVDSIMEWKPWEPLETPIPTGQWDDPFKQ